MATLNVVIVVMQLAVLVFSSQKYVLKLLDYPDFVCLSFTLRAFC